MCTNHSETPLMPFTADTVAKEEKVVAVIISQHKES
jgi:hypothetical protein